MNSYKLLELTQEDIPNYIELGLKQTPCVLYGIHDKTFAWICKEEMCDYDYIVNNNIPHKKLSNAIGSTIICSKEDLDLGVFGDEIFCKEMFNRINKKFSVLLSGGKFVNNDFMYNGNKYGAVTSIKFGDVLYLGIHISNEINKELIEKICKKKIYKVPEKLPNPITRDDIVEMFLDCDGGSVKYESDI